MPTESTDAQVNQQDPAAFGDAAEMTMRQDQEFDTASDCAANESCLVQIYPPDVIDGMLSLEEPTLRIGRDLDCGLTLNDGNVSRRHAVVRQTANGHVLVDLDSTNGTFVNGERIEQHELKSADRIAIGPFIFKYLSAGCIEAHYHEAVYSSLTRDALTGAFNKRYLLESMQREIARAKRDKQPISVVMMDIDHFKSVNDNYGHLVGDEVLREFGNRLLDICREDDLFARYGGEEFSLLLASTDQQEALEIAGRCRQRIADLPFATQAGQLPVTASFGIASYYGDRPVACEDLISVADERLYAAKEAGRNRVVAG